MRGTVAKRLRKKFDYKPYAKRKSSHVSGTIANVGKRQQYQDAKKDYSRHK